MPSHPAGAHAKRHAACSSASGARYIFADDECAYFSHTMYTRHGQAAEVLVKMKFKQGSITVPPSAFLPHGFEVMPEKVSRWESVLQLL